MNAIVVDEHGGPGVLSVEDRPEPTPGAGEVKIAVEAAGVNFADIERRRGTYPDRPDVRCPVPPYVPGSEAAGRVVEAGDHTDFERGDDVMGLLCYASYGEYATVPADRVMPVPGTLSYEAAAGVPIRFITAHNALFEWGGLEAGETVLVHAGAGGVGSAAIQFAARIDCTIHTTASTGRKRDFSRSLGADRAIDYTTESVAAVADEELDGGYDLVLDGVGGNAFKESVRSLAPGGRIVSYGAASGNVPTIAVPRLLFENRTVRGYHVEHAYANLRERVLSAKENVLRLFRDGALDVVVDRTFPLEAASDAHRHIEDRANVGKVVLEVGR